MTFKFIRIKMYLKMYERNNHSSLSLSEAKHHHTRYMKHCSSQYICRTLTATDIKLNELNPVTLFLPSLIRHPAVATMNVIILMVDHGF